MSKASSPLVSLFFSVVPLLALGCSTLPNDDTPVPKCTGACDGFATPPPLLEPVPLTELGRCWGRIDESTTDPFFQVHDLECAIRVPSGLLVDRIYADVRTADGDYQGGVYEGDSLHGEDLTLARFHGDDLPVTVRITIPMAFEGSDARTAYWGVETVIADLDALAAMTEDAPITFGPPVDLWPVVLWPDSDLVAGWGDSVRGLYERTDYGVAVSSAELAVGGPSPAEALRFRRSAVSRPSELDARDIGTIVRMVPVPAEGFAVEPLFAELPQLAITTFTGGVTERIVELDGPGYYLVAADGTASRTAPEDLPLFPEEAMDAGALADAPIAPDAGLDEGAVDAASSDGGLAEDASPARSDPCLGACDATQACVGGTCVRRADQVQSSWCTPPTASCDPNEDGDCADGHACAGGLCRRLSCQTQDTFCNPPQSPCEDDADCELGHACAGGLCRRLSCQTQDTFCNPPQAPCEASTDCGEGHACVEDFCRRLTCQTQDTFCNPPQRSCAVDTDCATGHACADGLCRRLSCQTQDTFCNPATAVCEEDADCAVDHACASNTCRRLTCQTQDTWCNPARAPCETTSDCASDHVCEAGSCQRIACL